MSGGNFTVFEDETMGNKEMYGPFFGIIGSSAAMILTSYGAEYGTWKAGTSISTAGTVKPEIIIKCLLPVVMAGILAIYGLVAAVLIANAIKSSYEGYTIYKGFLHMGAGLIVGASGMSAGYAIGVVGEAGIRDFVSQKELFVGMVLILIFCEVLGLYGLIVGLILCTKD